MSDDLVTQMKEQASSDHVRGCQGRQYSCDCGYDIRGEGLFEQAAIALTEARAEIERLRAKPPLLDAQVKTLEAQLDEALRSCLAEREGRLEAETAISTLRARVREVVGPFAEIAGSEAFQLQTREWRDLVIAKPTGARLAFVQADSFRAARQLNKDLK